MRRDVITRQQIRCNRVWRGTYGPPVECFIWYVKGLCNEVICQKELLSKQMEGESFADYYAQTCCRRCWRLTFICLWRNPIEDGDPYGRKGWRAYHIFGCFLLSPRRDNLPVLWSRQECNRIKDEVSISVKFIPLLGQPLLLHGTPKWP